MYDFVKRFVRDESGAVTVDWVVITAAVVGLGIAVFAAVSEGVTNVAEDISGDIATRINTNSVTAAANTYSD